MTVSILRRKPISESCYSPPDDVFAEMRRLREQGLSNVQAAAAVGVPVQVAQISLSAYFTPIPDTPPERETDDPTPAEIRRACQAIQREWTPRERARRAGLDPNAAGWSLPVARLHAGDRRQEDAA